MVHVIITKLKLAGPKYEIYTNGSDIMSMDIDDQSCLDVSLALGKQYRSCYIVISTDQVIWKTVVF